MNTGTMIANAVTAGKSFRIRTTGRGFDQALAQLKASLQEVNTPAADLQPEFVQAAEPASRVRWMFLSGKDRAVRVIKL